MDSSEAKGVDSCPIDCMSGNGYLVMTVRLLGRVGAALRETVLSCNPPGTRKRPDL